MPKPETETSPFPLSVRKPIPNFVKLSIGQTSLVERRQLYTRGFFFVTDLLIGAEFMPVEAYNDLLCYLRTIGYYYSDLPTHPYLTERLHPPNISAELHRTIMMRLALMTNGVVPDYRDLGRPSFLALALLPDLDMDSVRWSEFEDLLALRELRPKMKFKEIFSHHQPFTLAPGEAYNLAVHRSSHPPMPIEVQPATEQARGLEVSNLLEETARGHDRFLKAYVPLNEEQMALLARSIYDVEFNEDTFIWISDHTGESPSMMDVFTTVLAVRDPPEELVAWFNSHNLPLQTISSAELATVQELSWIRNRKPI